MTALRRVLFVIAARTHSHLGFRFLAWRHGGSPLRRALTRWLAPHDPALASTVFGVRFPGPLGLAAGFDKDGRGLNTWGALGFGYAEVGTVTAQPQPGNPAAADVPAARRPGAAQPDGVQQPRCGRAGAAPGAAHAGGADRGQHRQDQGHAGRRRRRRLPPKVPGWSARWPRFWWSTSARPTRRGLRDLQAVESLRPILAAVLAETSTPVLVKIAPDLSDADVDEIADLAVELGLAGIVATNTTVSRSALMTRRASKRLARAAFPVRPSRSARRRCCAGCTGGLATGWC